MDSQHDPQTLRALADEADGRRHRTEFGKLGDPDLLREAAGALRTCADLAAERDALRAALRQARTALLEVEQQCPCGARPESLTTHPHASSCAVARALSALPARDE
jgi:hypothetical protein